MSEIHLNYRDTIQKSEQLEELAMKVQGTSVNNLENIGQRIGNTWKGDAGGAYRKKYDKVLTNLNNQGKNLKSVAVQMDNKARKLQNIEEMANHILGR